MNHHNTRHSPRGQASVLGVVFIMAITVIGITGVLLFGSTALETSHTQAEIDAAEQAMTQLDSRLSLVGLGSSEFQKSTVPLRSGASLRVDSDRGWMNVSVVNQTNGSVEIIVLNTTLGAVVYEHAGTSVAYQGGGVWKRSESGQSIMVSPPEVHYRAQSGTSPTLTLPLIVASTLSWSRVPVPRVLFTVRR